MLTFDPQNLIAMAIVASAAGFLARAVWRACRRPAGGCTACGTCPASKSGQDPVVVTIESMSTIRR